MGVELVTDREKKTPATKTAAQVVKRYASIENFTSGIFTCQEKMYVVSCHAL